jgi:hypothetical protein
MIWFACKQCGKRHGRPDNLAGTLVFCECGQGNRVPWSSTVSEPEPVEEPLVPVPPVPPPRARSEPGGFDLPPLRRRPGERRQPDPAYCLNHAEVASEQTCSDCRCPFCAACVTTLQGKTLCGPCKNLRIRRLSRPAHVSAMAIVSLVVGLIGFPVAFFLTLYAVGQQVLGKSAAGSIVIWLMALAVPAVALTLALLALREIETKPQVGGRSLAAGGAVSALASLLHSITLAILLFLRD